MQGITVHIAFERMREGRVAAALSKLMLALGEPELKLRAKKPAAEPETKWARPARPARPSRSPVQDVQALLDFFAGGRERTLAELEHYFGFRGKRLGGILGSFSRWHAKLYGVELTRVKRGGVAYYRLRKLGGTRR